MLNVFNLSLLLTVTRRSEQPFLTESVLIVQYNTIQYNPPQFKSELRSYMLEQQMDDR